MTNKGYHCDVVAPTSIPTPRTRQIKTDRIDAAQLAQFYANDLLTCVTVPEIEQEQDRDLLRSRQKVLTHQRELRTHIQALLRRNNAAGAWTRRSGDLYRPLALLADLDIDVAYRGVSRTRKL